MIPTPECPEHCALGWVVIEDCDCSAPLDCITNCETCNPWGE